MIIENEFISSDKMNKSFRSNRAEMYGDTVNVQSKASSTTRLESETIKVQNENKH